MSKTRRAWRRAAPGLGASTSLGCVALWLGVLFANPYRPQELWSGAGAMALTMIGLALAGLGASWGGSARALAAVALGSFVPVGFYVLLTPGVFRGLGLLNLGMLLAAIGLRAPRAAAGAPQS